MYSHYQGSLDVLALLQASPEQTKKQQEDTDRAMKKNHEKNRQAEQEPKERDISEARREPPDTKERKSGIGKVRRGSSLERGSRQSKAKKARSLLLLRFPRCLLRPILCASHCSSEGTEKQMPHVAECSLFLGKKEKN